MEESRAPGSKEDFLRMYCQNCGQALSEGAHFCRNCGAAIDETGAATPPAQAPSAQVNAAPAPSDASNPYAQQSAYQNPYAQDAQPPRAVNGTPYLVWAIISTILCFWPTGIPAIVFAAKINRCNEDGDAVAAAEAAKTSKIWTIVTAAVGFVLGVLGAVLLVGTLADF